MTQQKFNRKYREYQPSINTVEGPPTQRICKPTKCEDDTTTPEPPNPPFTY